MGWPQVTWIALAALSAGVIMSRNGKPIEQDKYDATPGLVRIAVVACLLYAGGFFH
jgi:hypothetical protein